MDPETITVDVKVTGRKSISEEIDLLLPIY